MKHHIYSIACDFGSSGGKIFLGIYNGEKLYLEIIYEFFLEPIKINEYYYTNVLYIWSELLIGLKKITQRGIQPTSLAIDTWGVDFAFLIRVVSYYVILLIIPQNRSLTINPIQATAIGNITSQLLALNVISNITEARKLIQKNFEVKII